MIKKKKLVRGQPGCGRAATAAGSWGGTRDSERSPAGGTSLEAGLRVAAKKLRREVSQRPGR